MAEKRLKFKLAQALVDVAIEEATTTGVAVAVSVVDSGGHLVSFARMDGVSYMAVEVTRRKAVTSAAFRVPSHALAIIANSDPAVAADLAKSADVCMIAGGVPIMQGSQSIGGLGVAGGRSEQDKEIAEKAMATLREGFGGESLAGSGFEDEEPEPGFKNES